MLRERARLFKGLLFTLDLLLTALSLQVSYQLHPIQEEVSFPGLVYACFFILLVWVVLLRGFHVYRFSLLYTLSAEIRALSKVVLVGGIILGFTLFILKEQAVSRQLIIWFLVIDLALLLSARLAVRLVNRYLRKRGQAMRNIVLVGDDERALEFARLIESTPWWGFKLLGFVTTETGGFLNTIRSQYEILGNIEDLPHMVTEMVVDEVVFVVPRKKLQELEEIFPLLEEVGINTRIALNFFPHVSALATISDLGDTPMISFSTTPDDGFPLLLKGLMDRFISLVLLLLLSPFMLGISIAAKIGSPGPVFMRQVRYGLHGRRFTMFTFRSTTVHAEQEQRPVKSSPDEAIQGTRTQGINTGGYTGSTFLGKWLKRSGADHLPLFLNVLKGQMSLVGPRPPLAQEVGKYERWQRRRLSMKPGITGLWHINRNELPDARQSLKMDLEYIDNWRLKLDFKILLRSIQTILF
jgi:exopolysaccharide biosynthesis polyprenyl glycosylphosphotransferase